MPSLPTVGGDSGTWGTELNTWLQTTLNADGTLNGTAQVESLISANTTVAGALQTTGGTVSGSLTVDGDVMLPVSAFSTVTGGFTGGGIRSSIGHIISNTFTQSVGPVVTTAAGASIGANVASISTLIVADTINPPTTGTLVVPTSGGTAYVTYTSYTSGTKTFGGITLVSGSGTILSTVGGVQTPLADPLLRSVHRDLAADRVQPDDQLPGRGRIPWRQRAADVHYCWRRCGRTSRACRGRGYLRLRGQQKLVRRDSSPVFQNEMIYKNDPAIRRQLLRR